MASKKLKVSLIVIAVLALGFLSASFFVGTEAPAEFPAVSDVPRAARLAIDFGDGELKSFTLEPHGENLFVLTKNKLFKERIELNYETYAGLGELITQIGDKKGGDGGRYWQYWINGAYANVGASSYVVKLGDTIEWKYTNEKQ